MVIKPQAVSSRSQAADELIRAAAGAIDAGAQMNGTVVPEPAPARELPAPQPQPQRADPDPGQNPEFTDEGSEVVQVPTAAFRTQVEGEGEEDPDPENYEHRFKVLQGKYKAETKRLRDDAAETKSQMQAMRDLMGMMQEQMNARPAAPAPAAPAAAPERPLVTEKEVEEFGADMLDAAHRFTLQKLTPRIAKIEQTLSELTGKVGEANTKANSAQHSVAVSARGSMFQLLDSKMPDWRDVNLDEDFKAWLEQEDDFAGDSRQALLIRAYEKNDGPRVLRFFKAFKAEHATGDEPAPASTPEPEGNPAPAAAARPGRVDPNALVAPGRGRSAARSTGAQQKIVWDPQSIAAFYADVRKGAYKTKPDEQARLETDIFKAQAEGRVAV